MLKKLITTIAVTLGIAILAACSGEEPASETNTNREEPRSEAAVAAPTKTTAPEPTRPQRLDQLLAPTTAPEAAGTATTVEPETKAEQPEKKNEAAPGSTPAPTSIIAIPALSTREAPTIAELVPEDPETNDRVLLQDIYGQIDLEQFALNPNEPIPANSSPWTVSPINYPEISKHPYLHLFNKVIDPPSSSRSPKWEQFEDQPRFKAYLMHFIHHPWFEPVYPNSPTLQDIQPEFQKKVTPYWFGNNSTRGILVETVAALLEEAQLPTSEPYPRGWWLSDRAITTDGPRLKNREWTIGEFIRTTLSTEDSIKTRGGNSKGECAGIFNERNEPHDDTRMNCMAIRHSINGHATPQVEWEIVHPQLPILKITAHASQTLPLQVLPLPPPVQDGSESVSDYVYRTNRQTVYSVSFVISLQNRWTSFDEPNRWVTRFREELTPPNVTDRSSGNIFFVIDERVPHPNQWDDTDYMQHRIIGPVLLTVHESPVLRPGTYSRVPRITHWEAPGYILTDKQIKTWKRGRLLDRKRDPETGRRIVLREGTPAVRLNPKRYYYSTATIIPNAGFPLPGHVMTTSTSGPGTEAWKTYEMEQWEEYDRSLGER